MRRGCASGDPDRTEDGSAIPIFSRTSPLRSLCCQARRSQKPLARNVRVTSQSFETDSQADVEAPGQHFPEPESKRFRCRRRREGAPVPRIAGAGPGFSKVRSARAVLFVLALLLLLRLRSYLPHPNSWTARMILLPLQAICNAEYTLIVLAPAICWMTLYIWSRLELPEQNGAAGQRISHILGTSLWVSLILVAITAGFGGDFSVRLVAALIYFPAAALWLVYRSDWCKSSRRLISTWVVFIPLIFEYKLMYWWLRFASLEQVTDAYKPLHEKYAPRVLRLLVDQGGIFVKIGQMLSLLPAGVLPEAHAVYCRV